MSYISRLVGPLENAFKGLPMACHTEVIHLNVSDLASHGIGDREVTLQSVVNEERGRTMADSLECLLLNRPHVMQ